MITSTIKSYLYQQYNDDEDLQALVDAYNGMTQAYLDWFVGTPLAYYPNLSGDLLDWAAWGIYGQQRPAFESQGVPVLGTLDTQVLNAAPLDAGTQPVIPVQYSLSDDIFQRLLTWNIFKGDGNRFCMRWLKRRIMRFFTGVAGIDPSPFLDPTFTIGAENTSAIGAVVAGGICTVTLYQVALQALVPDVTQQLIQVFETLFTTPGVLELPAQYIYTVNLA